MPDQPSKHGRQHHPNGPDATELPITLPFKVSGDRTADPVLATGDGQFIFGCWRELDDLSLVDIEIFVSTVSSSGKPTVQIRNITQGHDLLSTKAEIDASEFASADAATQPVISGSNRQVAHKDRIAIDVDVAGTGTKGLQVVLSFDRVDPPTP